MCLRRTNELAINPNATRGQNQLALSILLLGLIQVPG